MSTGNDTTPATESTDAPKVPSTQEIPPTPQPEHPAKRVSTTKPRPRKVYDPLLEAWYFNEINKRDAQDAQLFKNYQINPYTKKTLDYVTPKITERRRAFPKEPPANPCVRDETQKALSVDDQKLLESYRVVKSAIDRSVNPPQKKFCEPQTELMRLGWFPKLAPPPTPQTCLYLRMNKGMPCCYFYPTPPDQLQNEAYDERFRAVHTTAEFIKTELKLKQFDAVMNPNGFRGKVTTPKKSPVGLTGRDKK